MQIFNTMTRQKEEFTPQKEGEYRIYVCGPTVYNYIHIGNARPMIVFDTLRRYLEYCGNKVYYVSNITDIDDKLIKKGQEEGTSMQEVARKFEAEYIKDSDGLNVKTPTVRPRATEHIGEIIGIVKDLVESGHAYVARNGDVYFRVKSDPGYGKLSHLNLDDLESGNRELRSRMDDDLKEDPADFAVWKAAKPGEPYWESPWGHGRPGWHIECSAMARKHLGKTIDLHAGGQDLIFPHHENEIAQSECANGCTFSRYWMHNGFLNINNEKMSKSANNFFTVREIADKYGYEPIRYFMLTAGYRMPLNYTVELIESCKNSLERMYTCRDNLDFAIEHAHGTDTALVEKCEDARKKFKAAMDDDLNTPDALAAIFDLVKDINTLSDASDKATLETAAKTFDELTGVLGLLYNRKKTDAIPAEVTALVEERAAAKGLFLLTMKPILYVANVDEDMLNEDLAPIDGVKPLPICAKIEAELSELDPEDAADYLESLGLEQPGLDVLAQAAYKLLGLQSFFTAGEMEVKAWTVRQGATAPQAAGVIHTDFERGFIKAEVIGYDDYIELGGEQGAKAAGKLRIEGKDYVMADGDVVHFRFNV